MVEGRSAGATEVRDQLARRFAPAQRLITAFIDNAWQKPAEGKRLPVIDPATEDQVSEVEEADEGCVDRAATAARRAFRDGPWPRLSVERRQSVLRRIADLIDAHAEELAFLECLNSGIPMRHLAQGQIPRAALNFRFFAEYIGQSKGEVYTQDSRYLTFVTRSPVGVAALIGPWNAPLALTSMKMAAAVAFGNCCVAKPAEQTPLAVARLMELLAEAGLPEGVVNLVNGTGAVTGDALVRHPEIDVISFTGGTETGRKIAHAAAPAFKPTSLELGGKSANIIFASADFDCALDAALAGIFSNNGQQCLAGSRILVEQAIADRFIEAFVARTKALRLGDPMMVSTEIGPLAFSAHFARVLSYADIACAGGAEILTGGKRSTAFERGYYMEPTVVRVKSNSARIAQEEVFGPFATFILFDTVDEAIAIANQSRFGLVSYVWSEHLPTVMEAIGRIEAGLIWVNTPMARELRAPFGGVKDSGSGREGGSSSEAFYTYPKTSMVPRSTVPVARLGAVGANETTA